MNTPFLRRLLLWICVTGIAVAEETPLSAEAVEAIFAGRKGTLVVITDNSEPWIYQPEMADRKFAPCSTFKIWNTLIGLENDLISSPEEPFYQWDGEKRFVPEWNQNLTLKQAFQVSCVPAFQDLARRIGPERMQSALEKIGYGDRNISAAIGEFWLPEEGRRTVLISPVEQARLMARLAAGDVPFSEKSQDVLREIMTARTTLRGTLFGKTGTSGKNAAGDSLGWYVGYIESNGRTHAFACLLEDKDVMGKDARAIVEALAEKQGWL
jgi:Beta-lactamase class D